jgi:hypothetical protein
MLAQPTPTLTGSPGAARMPSFSHLSAPLLLSTPPYSTSSFHTPLSASPGASYVGHGAFTGAAAGPFPATATAQYGSPSKPGSSRMAEVSLMHAVAPASSVAPACLHIPKPVTAACVPHALPAVSLGSADPCFLACRGWGGPWRQLRKRWMQQEHARQVCSGAGA